jgi:outer membrane protein assembly factor BamB
MFNRFSWLWLLVAAPVVAVAGIVAADIVQSFNAPEPEPQPVAGPPKALPPCCEQGCELPVGLLPQAAGTTAKDAQPQATFGGGPDRNMVNLVAKNVPTSWSIEEGKQQNIKWSANLGKITYTGPVVAGSRVFVGTNNQEPRDPKLDGPKAVLMCFDAKDGKFLYQIVHDMPAEEVVRDALHCGLCSTPTVEGDFIYYCTPGCEVICARADSGKIVWKLDMMKDLKVFPCYLCTCSPLVVGDLIFVMTGNGRDAQDQLVSPKAPSFIAIHKASGKVAWQSSLPGPNIIEGQWSNPAYAVVNGKPQVIFGAGDGYLYGVAAADGQLIWKFNCSPKVANPDKDGKSYILATPVVYQNKVYVGTGAAPETGRPPPRAGHFFCIDITRTGDVSCKNDNFDPKAPENKDSALVWHYGGVNPAKPAKGGRPDRLFFGRTLSTAAIHDGLVYISEEKGYLHCLDASTGQHYWEADFKTGISASPYWVDGKIYMCTEDGDLHIFAHGKEMKEIGKVDMDEVLQATPTVVDGVLYVTTKSKVYAIGKGK